MICKEGAIDVISIGGNVVHTTNTLGGGVGNHHHHHHHHNNTNGGNNSMNGHHTLQHRRKSQLITFSASSCDIKNSLSHEIILVNSNGGGNNSGSNGVGPIGGGPRGSIVGSISNNSAAIISNGSAGSGGSAGGANMRLSFAEEDIMIVTNGNRSGGGNGDGGSAGCGSASVSGGSGHSAGSGSGSGSGNDGDLDDDVFHRRSLDVDEEEEADLEEEEEDDGLFDDVYGTHIDVPHNANDDSGGGSYEDSHAMHSSLAGSNRNSLEKDDDDIDADVISTDVSCYDQLLGTSCNTRNDEDEIATLVGEGESYTKLCKGGVKGTTTLNGVGSGVGVGENGGIIYANPFLDDEGIAESGM